jgi:DNA polymerase III subunit gamma/tau
VKKAAEAPAKMPPPAPTPAEPDEKAEPRTIEVEVPAAPQAAPPVSLSVQAVQARWPAMVERVGQEDKNLPALLAMCKPLAIEGDTLVLGFDFPVLKEKFESKPKHASPSARS